MGKQIKETSSVSTQHSNPPSRVKGILHIMKYHQWRHVKKRLTHRKHGGGGTAARFETPGPVDSTEDDNLQKQEESDLTSSNVEKPRVQSTPSAKHSVKSRLKALLPEEISKKKGRHNRSSTCPTKCHRARCEGINHLNASDLDPLGEMLLALESSEIFAETTGSHHATKSLDVSPLVFSEELTPNNENCVECDTISPSDSLEHSQIHKQEKDLAENQTFLQKTSSCSILGNPEEKLIHAKILTADASPQVFKDFLDALEIMNTNKDFLLKVLRHPSPSLAHHHQKQQMLVGKMTLTKSLSFPIRASSSGSKSSELGKLKRMDDDRKNETRERQSSIESEIKIECPSKASEDFQQQSMYSNSSNKFDRIPSLKENFSERGSNSLSVSAPGQNQMVMKRFKNLRQKIKHVIADSKSERHRIAMDGVLHKIPHGNNLSEELKKIIDKSKCPRFNGEREENSTSGYDIRLPSYSFRKHQPPPMRTTSLKESMHKYSQLYETIFNRDDKCPKFESLRLGPEDTSSAIKTQKLLKRFLSMPNIRSYFPQNDEPPVVLSPMKPIGKYVERTTSISITDEKSLDHSDSNKLPDYTIQESIPDSVDCSEQDAELTRESATLVEEAKSVFSEYSSSNDINLEKSSLVEEAKSQLKQGLSDELADVNDQQEKIMDYPEEHFDNPTSLIEVDARNIAEFNYVRKVSEMSGFTCHKPLGIWHSDDQPVDPLIYEELEDCWPSGPNCSYRPLFDLINEVLADIFGRSYSYYPNPLSSVCHLRQMPTGQRVLREIWTLIRFYLNSTSPDYQSLDYYSSRDLSKPDGWMNLQFDSECVALQLDDSIFDDLLEEVISTRH